MGTIKPILSLLVLILRKVCSEMTKPIMAMHTFSPNTQGRSGKISEFQASQGYRMRHFLKNIKQQQQNRNKTKNPINEQSFRLPS